MSDIPERGYGSWPGWRRRVKRRSRRTNKAVELDVSSAGEHDEDETDKWIAFLMERYGPTAQEKIETVEGMAESVAFHP